MFLIRFQEYFAKILLFHECNQSIDMRIKSMDLFLYDNGLRHERVNLAYKWLQPLLRNFVRLK